MSDEREFTTAELTAAILRTVAKESERERRELGVDRNPRCCDPECLRKRIDELERDNAALRHSEENLASTVRGLEFENEKLERENAALERTIENLRARLWGTEFELEKAKAELDWLNTNCVSADPIMGRSTYRWTIEHDEPDIRAAIAKLRKAQA